MILEGIVTTVSPEGSVNIAPMGPVVDEAMQRLLLRPYQTARTYQNLKYHPEGVLHITDDVLLLARAAIGEVDPLPALEPASCIRGWILKDCCRYFEFQIDQFDDSADRATLQARVVHSSSVRDFFGFNRAKHAVVEAAILATRVTLLPPEEIRAEFAKLEPIVHKTGGSQECQAFALLREHVEHAANQKLAGAVR
jgi:uncharacterized protein